MKTNLDTNENFNKMMQDASDIYARKKYDDVVDEIFLKELIERKRMSRKNHILKCASIVMIILLTGVSAGIWFNAEGAYGGKTVLQKYVSVMDPLEIKEEVDEDGNVTVSAVVDNEKDIKKIAGYFENLMIAEYVPPAYKFKNLSLSEVGENTTIKYIYEKGKDSLIISFDYYNHEPEIMVTGKPYSSPKTGQLLYINEIDGTDEYSVIEIKDEYDCVVTGIGNVKEGIKIIESIKQY